MMRDAPPPTRPLERTFIASGAAPPIASSTGDRYPGNGIQAVLTARVKVRLRRCLRHPRTTLTHGVKTATWETIVMEGDGGLTRIRNRGITIPTQGIIIMAKTAPR
jgi:hypothetical protein